MKRITPLVVLLTVFSTSLLSCKKTSNGTAYDMPDDYPDSERRLVDPKDYLVDYSKGGSSNFFLAHGYSNRGMFNCTWSRDAGKVENNKLNLSLYEKNGVYYGAEYRSIQPNYSYGYYATRMKPIKCSGVISSFFTYTGRPYWNEIDIEFLGKNTTQVQFNYFNKNEAGHAYLYQLKFDASEDFHEYGFEWLKESIAWYIDGIKVYEVKADDIPDESQHIMMNVWNCTGKDFWSGPFDPSKLPVTAQYEFIAYIPANS